jgi:hypothetical protein
MSEPTRYAKSEAKKKRMARHAAILEKLSSPFVMSWEEALVEFQPDCVTGEYPSPWVDYDRVPENREPYEGMMPTAKEAEEMCEGCPILKLCFDRALAKGETHGVWGGKRFGPDGLIPDGVDSVDRSNRERD